MDMKVERSRHDRLMGLPPLLRGGFRPFFLGGAVWALVVVALWVCALSGAVTLPTAFDPLAWHRHEMLFGYLGAVIAGFLLTAIPNWTGRPPLAGAPLAALAVLWLAARFAILFSATIGSSIALALDVGFLLVLAAVAGREIVAAKNRNVPIVIVILLFAAASALDHTETLGLASTTGAGWRAGFALVLMLIGLIGGRIIPAFTRNWLMKQGRKHGLPAQPSRFDIGSLALTALALGGWTFAPDARLVAILLLGAGLLQAVRLSRWSGLSAARDPLVLILHIAYAWLPIGLLLLGASILSPAVPATSALHALAAGAMASMTLAVMTRATRGHTGYPLTADRWTVLIYSLVTFGAAVRVGSPLIPFDYMRVIELAGTLWGGAFLVFVLAYGPKLIGPRRDGQP
ncbi:NnrS family protein [Sphingosinicella humi]|nr:NnrS family protein [Sphingosinicella humi]